MPRHSFRRRTPRPDIANDLIFGRNPVLETMRASPTSIEKVLVAAGVHGAEAIVTEAGSLGLPIETVARDVLDAMVGGANHQGVAARAKRLGMVSLEDLIGRGSPMLVLLDGILDPQNLGAIIRSAEVLGAGGLVLPKDRSATVTPAAVRASSGAAVHLPIAQVVNLVRAIEILKAAGFWVVGLDAKGTSRFQDLPVVERVVLIIGGEGRGMRALVTRACDFVVSIPIRGRVGSLNAAAAAAIALYELGARVIPPGTRGHIR